MRSTNYPRVSRAVLCSALLLSQHAVVDANNWTTRRASSSRSSTLAVMQPGGRNRPIRDYKAMKRESEEKLARQAEEKTQELARQRGELIEEIEGEVIEAVEDRLDKLDTASAEVLDLEEGTPEALGVMLAKVAVIATVGIYGAKKVVAFAKAFIKARKEAPEDAAGEVSTATKGDDDDQDEGGDEKAAEADGEEGAEEEEEEEEEEQEQEQENAAPTAVEEDGDEVTDGDGDGYVTAEEEEEEKDALKAAAASALRGMGEAAKDMAEGILESVGDSASRGDGEGDVDAGEEAEEGDLRAQVAQGGKVDVSYV